MPDEATHGPELAEMLAKPIPGANLNDVYVDKNAIVYTVDRQWGGLYTLELTF